MLRSNDWYICKISVACECWTCSGKANLKEVLTTFFPLPTICRYDSIPWKNERLFSYQVHSTTKHLPNKLVEERVW